MVSEEMAQVAARWWREKIDGGARHDNGDSRLEGILAGIMADSLNEPTDGHALDLFEKILALRLLEEGEKGRKCFSIGSDYGPGGCLLDSALEAGITPHNFPWKTWMYILEDRIEVRDGYQAPNVVIWPAQDGQTRNLREIRRRTKQMKSICCGSAADEILPDNTRYR